MDTTHVKITEIERGSLLSVAGGIGFVIADTLSADPDGADGFGEPIPFWYDTDGGRHYGDRETGTLVIGLPGFRTQEYGQAKGGYGHALLNEVPGAMPKGYCSGSRNADLSVWSSGTALAAVDCPQCRKLTGLVNVPPSERVRRSSGI